MENLETLDLKIDRLHCNKNKNLAFYSLDWKILLHFDLEYEIYSTIQTSQKYMTNYRWLPPGTPVSSTNTITRHDITERLLKVALNTINKLIII